MWCVDQISFAGVTIGVARLQGMLRDLGPEWSGDKTTDPSAPAVLLIVPENVHHTLGALVLSGQLRRRGLSVRLILGEPPGNIVVRLRRTNFSAVMVSASQSESLETIRRIIDVVRNAVQQPPPVVVGGGILEVETVENVTALTGADYATKNIEEALKLCGIKVPKQNETTSKGGS